METQSKDILQQLLERLDKMDSQQHKLDRVMERLDTLQNILERQNQKQNLLDETLIEITIKREQEKSAMAEQLQQALQEIVEPFHANDSQGGSTPSPYKNTQPLQSVGTQIGDKLRSIEDKTVEAVQKCHQLTSWSHKMEDKMTQLASNSVEMETFLLEIRSVKDLIKGQTNSELIWLNNKMDKKLSDIGSVVRDIHQQQIETKEETVRSTGQHVNTDMQHGQLSGDTNEPLSDKQLLKELCDKQMVVILDLDRKIEQLNSSVLIFSKDVKGSSENILTTNKQSIMELENIMSNSIAGMKESSKEQSLLLKETLKSDLNKHFESVQSELQTNRKTVITESETQTGRIISAAETAKEDLRHLIQTEGDNTSKYKEEMESLHSLINSILSSMQEKLETVLKSVDSTEASKRELQNIVSNSLAGINKSSKEQSLLLNKTLKSDLNKHFGAVQSELKTNRKTVITESEKQTNRIISAAETAKEDLRHLIQTEGDNRSKYKVEMENLHSLINSILNKMKENLEFTVKKVDSTEASIISKHETVNTKFEELNTDLKDYIYETKREIFAITEKEAQIVRDRIQGPLPSQGKYTFDFYLNNFKNLVKSGKGVDSLPWHINELQTCVTGSVTMSTNGEMNVWLLNGRHPREVGLQLRSGKTLKVKATICDIDNKKLPPVDVGERSMSVNEAEITWNGAWGMDVGVTSCDVLLKGGYGEQEGYSQGALLIRYEVTVQ